MGKTFRLQKILSKNGMLIVDVLVTRVISSQFSWSLHYCPLIQGSDAENCSLILNPAAFFIIPEFSMTDAISVLSSRLKKVQPAFANGSLILKPSFILQSHSSSSIVFFTKDISSSYLLVLSWNNGFKLKTNGKLTIKICQEKKQERAAKIKYWYPVSFTEIYSSSSSSLILEVLLLGLIGMYIFVKF